MTAAIWSREVVEEEGPRGPLRRYRMRPPSLPAVLDATADRWPDRVHLVQGGDRRTFAEHRLAVRRAAGVLREAGVRPGDRVGILAANSPAWIASLWACWEIGAVAAPFNWSWTTEQIHGVIDDCSPAVVLVDAEHAPQVPSGIALPMSRLDDGPADDEPAGLPVVDETMPGLIIYTSGTTGRPKGATFTQGAVIASVQNALVGSRLPHELPDEPPPGVPMPVSLLSYPVFHMAGTMNVLVTTAIGGRLVFAGPKFDAVEILRLIERERVTAWGAVPTMAQRAADALADHHIDVSSLRAITLGGAPMPPGLPATLAERFGSLRGGASNAYGQTEVGGTVTIGGARDAAADPTCVGAPLGVAEICIDSPAGGGTGEVLVRTPSAMLGYWGQDESPIGDDGWVHTGDVGYLDDEGRLHIVDRIKDIIIRGGENISPTAVEEAIASHPSVDEVSVFSVPDADFGEAIAAVVVTSDPALTSDDLVAHARLTLSRFEVPEHWWIRSEPLERGTLDKVLRRQLRDEWLSTTARPS
ncbi:class I adenylate-forming enzyme family protein [Desertimonas flava]|uniref:class I adenylate-forming enzyme family protein n=1 Tax=Desertimonas flava TaxID=2064846 RepID=UPI000E34B88F|nr:class I adenylate-forming enzyme family protein [Desertimonas flava]